MRCVVPALLTTMFNPEKVSSVTFSIAFQSASLDTSPLKNAALPPAALISPATRSPPSTLMSFTTILQPSSAKRLAMPSPKPEPAPVTIAILFFNLICPPLRNDAPKPGKKDGSLTGSHRYFIRSGGSGPSNGRAHLLIAVGRNFLTFPGADSVQVHAVTHRGHLRKNGHRDLGRGLAADAQSDRPVQ